MPNERTIIKVIPQYRKETLFSYIVIKHLVVCSHFTEFENLLYTYQSGFQKKAVYWFCLSNWNNHITKGFDLGMMVEIILIDLQKFYKTYVLFPKYIVNWFKHYLSNRTFLINLANNFSEAASISCGVPQGSILETILFLIHITELSQTVKCYLFLYAHDWCHFCQYKDINEIEKTVKWRYL